MIDHQIDAGLALCAGLGGLGDGRLQYRHVGFLLKCLEDQRGVGGCILRRVCRQGFKVAGVGDNRGH